MRAGVAVDDDEVDRQGDREDRDDNGLVLIVFPPVAGRQGKDGDRQQQQREGGHAPGRQLVSQRIGLAVRAGGRRMVLGSRGLVLRVQNAAPENSAHGEQDDSQAQ